MIWRFVSSVSGGTRLEVGIGLVEEVLGETGEGGAEPADAPCADQAAGRRARVRAVPTRSGEG